MKLQNIKSLFRTLRQAWVSFCIFNFAFFIPSLVHAAPPTYGLDETAKSAGIPGVSTTPIGPAAVAGNIIGYILAFVGVIFFGLMVYGGFLWMTARGNETQVKKARDLIEHAAIGMVIIFLSYVITNFVLNRLVASIGS